MKLPLYLLLAVSVFGQTPTLTYSSSTVDNYPLAVSGNSPSAITVTSNLSVNWSCAGAGTCSFTNPSTTMTFTPPAHVVNAHQIGGCPIGPNDSIFNTNIASAPSNSSSSTWLTAGNITSQQPTFAGDLARLITFVNSGSPTRVFKAYYSATNATIPWPPAEGSATGRNREGGNNVGVNYAQVSTNAFTDHHVLEVNTTDCSINEIYDETQVGTPNQNSAQSWFGAFSGSTVNCQNGTSSGCNASSTAQYSGLQYSQGTTTTTEGTGASGISELVFYPTLAELRSGSIKHVIRYVSPSGYIDNSFVWPSIKVQGGGCATAGNCSPMGGWFKLNSSITAGSVCTNGNATEIAYCTTLINQQHNYGNMLVDGGSAIYGSSAEWSQDPDAVAAAHDVALPLNATNYTFINVAGAQAATNSVQVLPSGTVAPSQYASISAAPAGGGTTVTKPVFLQGIGIGMQSQQLNIASGASVQLSWWVEPSAASQSVTWAPTSGVGSVTSGGVYTAPTLSANAAIGKAVLTGTAAADSSSTVTVYVNVLPYSTDGSIRLAGFGYGNLTDATPAANVWYDCCLTSGLTLSTGTTYLAIPTSQTLEATVYNSTINTYGNDLRWDIALPNGNYQIRFMYAQSGNNQWPGGSMPYNNCQCGYIASDASSNVLTLGGLRPYDIEANGQTVAHWYDPFYASPCNYQWACPHDFYIPATVTNGTLYFAQRSLASDLAGFLGAGSTLKFNSVNGVQIIPDSTSAYLTIDAGSNTIANMQIAPGTSSQPLWAIQHYFSGGTTTWNLSGSVCGSGAGQVTCTLSNDGGEMLTLGSGTPLANQPIILTATNGSHSASATLYTAGTQVLVIP